MLLEKRGVSVGKFLPIIDYDLPPKPVDIAENKRLVRSIDEKQLR